MRGEQNRGNSLKLLEPPKRLQARRLQILLLQMGSYYYSKQGGNSDHTVQLRELAGQALLAAGRQVEL